MIQQMVKNVFVALFMVCATVTLANAQGTTKADTVVVTAQLTEIPGKFAPNDLYNYVYIMKYRVIKVEKGTYTEKEILVGHYNPLIARKNLKGDITKNVKGDVEKFVQGAKHKLVLVTPIDAVWSEAVDDNYIDSDLPKFFAVSADIIK